MYGANNYGYNPYGRYMVPTQMSAPQQPINNPYKLNGKQVESFDVVKSMDIPLDGSISYFPIADGSAIVTKQFQFDGSCKTLVYKPVLDEAQPKSELDLLKEEVNKLKEEIEALKGKEGEEHAE